MGSLSDWQNELIREIIPENMILMIGNGQVEIELSYWKMFQMFQCFKTDIWLPFQF